MARICAGQGLRSIALLLATTVGVVSVGVAARASDAPSKPARAKSAAKTPAPTVDLFDGMKSGDIDVKLIATDSTKGNVMITNKTKQPISVRLPKAFAGAPVLAQNFAPPAFGPGNGGRNGATNGIAGGQNGMNQTVGGGFNPGLNGGNARGPNGFMNIPAEKTGKLRVSLVCLEHAKADPRATIPYEVKPIESFTKSIAVQELCAMLGEGKVEQRVAQVAAWHLANGLSYDALAAKQLEEIGSPARPYFSSQEMAAAVAVVDKAKDRAEQIESGTQPTIAQKTTSSSETTVTPARQTDISQAVVSTVSTAAAIEKPVARRKTRSR